MLMIAVALLLPLVVWAVESHEDEMRRSREINQLIRGNRVWEQMVETNERLTRVRYTKAGGR